MAHQRQGRLQQSMTLGTGTNKVAQPMVPLHNLLNNELQKEVVENPNVYCGLAIQTKKSEDFPLAKLNCQRIPGDDSSTYSVFAMYLCKRLSDMNGSNSCQLLTVRKQRCLLASETWGDVLIEQIFDGHNGAAAAIYSKENLLNDVINAVPPGLNRDEWLAVLPRAMVAGFVKTDKEFQKKGQTSGTTATLVIVDGWTVTVACVGDSRCVLDSQGTVTALSVDHRLDTHEEERERVKASGGQVARLNIVGGVEIGPLRVWPGGLCLSRSIGDMDVGEYIVPIPHVKQVKLSSGGGRLIIASDGVWDTLSSEKASRCCRGVQQPEVAAKYVVKEALRSRGLRDDTTCLVVDLVPPGSSQPFPAPKKQISIMKIFRRPGPKENRLSAVTIMEELFEESSAMLGERLGPESSVHAGNGMFLCAICRCSLHADEGISVHAGSFFSQTSNLWEGPFLCESCKKKKDAMEGKRNPLTSQVRTSTQNKPE